MNTPKQIIDSIVSICDAIEHGNRRELIDEKLRPLIAELKGKHGCFSIPRDKFDLMISNVEGFTTIVWTRAKGHESKGKVASEAMKLIQYVK